MNSETRQMGMNQFCQLHQQEQKMRLLMEHIRDLDEYAERKKQLAVLERALGIYTAKLSSATKKSFQAKNDKEEANDDYTEARSRLCRDVQLDNLFNRVDLAYIRSMNASADVARLTFECESRREQIAELSFQLNRLRAKMIRMNNPCYKRRH